MNFSPTVTVIIIYVIDILFSLATILFMIQDHTIVVETLLFFLGDLIFSSIDFTNFGLLSEIILV